MGKELKIQWTGNNPVFKNLGPSFSKENKLGPTTEFQIWASWT